MLKTTDDHAVDVNVCFDSYPQSWYPVCLSRSLKKNRLMLKKAFGRDWILFRNEWNQVGMLARHCPHMGADLSNARIVNGCIECPLHHWRYNVNGECDHAKSQRGRGNPLNMLRTIESYGIVFAYWGEEPLFALPQFEHLKNPMISRPYVLDCHMPLLMMGMNGYDTTHFGVVHHRPLHGTPRIYANHPYHLGIHYQSRVKPVNLYDKLVYYSGKKTLAIQLDCWGGNYFVVNNVGTDFSAMAIGLPIDTHHTRIFIVGAVEASESLVRKLSLDKIKRLFSGLLAVEFLKPDMSILNHIQPDFSHPQIQQNTVMMRFLAYWQRLPSMPGGPHVIP